MTASNSIFSPPSSAQIAAMRRQNPFDALLYPVYHPETPDSFYLESPQTTLVPLFQELSSEESTNPNHNPSTFSFSAQTPDPTHSYNSSVPAYHQPSQPLTSTGPSSSSTSTALHDATQHKLDRLIYVVEQQSRNIELLICSSLRPIYPLPPPPPAAPCTPPEVIHLNQSSSGISYDPSTVAPLNTQPPPHPSIINLTADDASVQSTSTHVFSSSDKELKIPSFSYIDSPTECRQWYDLVLSLLAA